MLLFVGQVSTGQRGREAFQEIDYRAVFGGLAKWTTEIDHAERIPELLARAWALATTGRPGPVVIALPEDMLSATTTAPPLTAPPALRAPAPLPEDVDAARALLSGALRPLIVVGGTNWTEAGRTALLDFATASDIPVAAAFRYQDQVDNFAEVFCGEAGVGMPAHMRGILAEADVILAINIRFGEMTTGGYQLIAPPCPRQRVIHVHPEPSELCKVVVPELGIVADPSRFAGALRPVAGPWSDWRTSARGSYRSSLIAPPQPGGVDMGRVIAHLQHVLPDDAILTNGAGNFAVWPNKFFSFGPRARLLAPQSGAMGYGLPAAIAAKAVFRDRCVVCIAGDGDFQMTSQELATARQMDAAPVVLVVNNGIYGTIRAHQERDFPGRVSGTTMISPDFFALARSYGMHGERVSQTEAFPAALERALAARTGAVLDLDVSPEALTPHRTLSEIRGDMA